MRGDEGVFPQALSAPPPHPALRALLPAGEKRESAGGALLRGTSPGDAVSYLCDGVRQGCRNGLFACGGRGRLWSGGFADLAPFVFEAVELGLGDWLGRHGGSFH